MNTSCHFTKTQTFMSCAELLLLKLNFARSPNIEQVERKTTKTISMLIELDKTVR